MSKLRRTAMATIAVLIIAVLSISAAVSAAPQASQTPAITLTSGIRVIAASDGVRQVNFGSRRRHSDDRLPATAQPSTIESAACTTNLLAWATGNAALIAVPSTGNTAASTFCHLSPGRTGFLVRNLQTTLNACYGPTGLIARKFSPALVVDSNYGAKTTAALAAAQRHHAISADGVYGPQTRDTIYFHPGGSTCYRLRQPITVFVPAPLTESHNALP